MIQGPGVNRAKSSENCPMKLIVRRVLIGLVCGTVSSPFLCLAVRDIGLGVVLGALLGIAQMFASFDLGGGSAIDRGMTCAALGLPFWATINVIFCHCSQATATMDSGGNEDTIAGISLLAVIPLFSGDPVPSSPETGPLLFRSRVTGLRDFPSGKNGSGSYSRWWLRRSNNSTTSRKAVPG